MDELDLDKDHPFLATRADLLRRPGPNSEAAAAYERAADMAPRDAGRTSSGPAAELRVERTLDFKDVVARVPPS